MAIVLDTHAALWYALGDSRLSTEARTNIDQEIQFRYLSPASLWEMAIKIRLGAYTLQIPFEDFWHEAIVRCGFAVLPINLRHASRICELPLIHRDPFDRMLVSQALCEDFRLVSNDRRLDAYGIRRIW